MTVGNYRSAAQVRTLSHAVGRLWGVGPQGLFVSYYGFPTCPVLPVGDLEGAGRLPPNLNPNWAGHPAFWLDEQTRVKLPTETGQQYIIRIYMELLLRSYWEDPHSEGGQFLLYNVFDLDGVDRTDLQFRQRLVKYIQGEKRDPYFNGMALAIGQRDQYPPDFCKNESQLQVLRYELAWQAWMGQDEQAYFEQIYQTIAIFEDLQPKEALRSWAHIVDRFVNHPRDGGRETIAEEAARLAQGVDYLYQHLMVLELTAEPFIEPDQIDQIFLVFEAQQSQRSADLTAAVENIYLGEIQPIKVLSTLFLEWLTGAKDRATQLLASNAGLHWIDERYHLRVQLLDFYREPLAALGYDLDADLKQLDAEEAS